MRRLLQTSLAIVMCSVFFFACNDDDENNAAGGGDRQVADAQNASEENPVAIAAINTGIEIPGATKNSGTPPTPTNNVDFQIATTDQEAFQQSGFNITFNSTDSDIAGAFIQFKEENGETASDFFDVSSSQFIENDEEDDEGQYINVDFGEDIPAGRFCYEICLYDDQQNVSRVETICVEVEAWGGNADFVGEWRYDRDEPEEGKFVLPCADFVRTVEAAFALYEKREIDVAFEEDGGFVLTLDEISQSLDIFETVQQCEAVYESEMEPFRLRTTGKWAFNEESGTMTIVAFMDEDLIDPSQNEEFENGEIITEDLKAEIVNNQLVLTESIDDDLGGIMELKTFFKRK